jgi:hypothetical protein
MLKFITTVADSISYRQVAFLAHFFGVSPPANEMMNVRNDAKNQIRPEQVAELRGHENNHQELALIVQHSQRCVEQDSTG